MALLVGAGVAGADADLLLVRHIGFLDTLRKRWRAAGVHASIQLDVSAGLRHRVRRSPAIRSLLRSFDAERKAFSQDHSDAKIVYVRASESVGSMDFAEFDKRFPGRIVLTTPSLSSYDPASLPYMDLAQLSTELVQSVRQAASEGRIRKAGFLRRFENTPPGDIVLLLTGKAGLDRVKHNPLNWPKIAALDTLFEILLITTRELESSK